MAGCSSDFGRYGDQGYYAPGTSNQQAILGQPQYAPRPNYAPAPDQTGSIGPGYTSAPLPPAPGYGQPNYTAQPLPPQSTYRPQVAQTYQPPRYTPPQVTQPAYPTYTPPAYTPPQPGYQPLKTVQSQPVGPRVAALQPSTQPLPPAPLAPPPKPAGPRVAALSTPTPPAPISQPMPSKPAAPGPLFTGTTAPPPVATNAPQTPNGWSSAGGSYVQLRQGETIADLSKRYGVPVNAIMAANNFADASRVQPGQQVLIPTYVYSTPQHQPQPAQAVAPMPAPIAQPAPAKTSAVTPPPPPPAPSQRVAPTQPAAPLTTGSTLVSGGEHVVRKGDTLELISRTYGIPKDKIRQANHIKSDTAPLKPGQRLVIPLIGGRHVAQATAPQPVATVAPGTAKPLVQPAQVAQAPVAPKPADAPTQTAAIAVEPKPTVESPRTDPAKTEAKTTAPSFRWPVRGRVIADFGSKPGADRNDGINMAVPEGTSVKSAEDGEVVYSGNELKGYGNVVLVKHADGWVSVYAHASDLLVNKGDKVTRGQIIARAGATGSVSQPQLHFELRKGQRPVDPKTYLTN